MPQSTDRTESLPRRATSVAVEGDVMVPMRDGVLLATDVYRPSSDGGPASDPLPVLVLRTPYDKTQVAELFGWPRLFARHGYVAVVQDCRGCFNSQGEVGFLWPEADDGRSTVEWIRRQPWCNGVVGTWGCSWESWTQTALAAVGTEGIAAMIATQSGANAHTSSVRQGGAMELRFIAWAFWHSACNTQAQLKHDPTIDAALNAGAAQFSHWLARWPIRPGATQLALVPPYERWVFELLTQGDYDERWRHPSVNPLAHLDTFTDAPVLLVGGWYDSYTRATFELFEGLSASKRGPIRVLVGPWVHGDEAIEQPFAGDVWFGHDATLDFAAVHLRWYDRWLKDVDNGVEDDAPVRIFVMGGGPGTRGPGGRLHHGGRWRDEHEWPLARTRFTPYYLHEDGGLHVDPPSVRESSTTFTFDPSNPVPTVGGNLSSLADLARLPARVARPSIAHFSERLCDIVLGGGFDQREAPGLFGCEPPLLSLATRPDILVFQTPPLKEDVEVTGPIAVHLWVASSAIDTDVTAKLIDVYPPSESYPSGYALNLTDSILRLRYRDDPSTPTWLAPGEAVSVTITLYPTSNLFVAGHRIRLDISSSNFPRFDVNPNTGEPLGSERRRAIAENTIFHDAARPSHVVLPLIPSA
jgi:putative CocE/NonD family hydrolase